VVSKSRITLEGMAQADSKALEPRQYVSIRSSLQQAAGSFDRKECGHIMIRSLTPPQAAGIALAFAVR